MMKFMLMIMMAMMIMNNNLKITFTVTIMMFSMSLQTHTNSKSSYVFSSDLISFWITMMTLMMFYVMMFLTKTKKSAYKNLMIMMAVALVTTFNNWNFLMFYLMFEMSMIVILLVIVSWGYQPERIEAIMFMVIMTLMFSLPFLMAMMMNHKTMNFWFMEMNTNTMIFLSFTFMFMMKMPIYFTHFWLPKVHVEAPVQGSMILAAIMLKLGCYGMIRMNKMITKFSKMKPMLMAISSISMMILAMNCIMQTDIKTMIAYSSIVHMTMVFMNIMLMKDKSMYSSMLIILGHGMCAASMFFMANMMYENSKSRSIMMNKGMMNKMPMMELMWFVTCMNNAPMPPSMNMLGELVSFKNMMSWSDKILMLIIMTAMVSSMYSIYLFYLPSHGKLSKMENKMEAKNSKYLLMMITMTTPITTMTIKPSMMILM